MDLSMVLGAMPRQVKRLTAVKMQLPVYRFILFMERI
jgi:hypothetical protein